MDQIGDPPTTELAARASARAPGSRTTSTTPSATRCSPASSPARLKRALPPSAPAAGEPLDTILDDFEHLIVRANTNLSHPGFMAYFGITGSIPGIPGELLAAALNVNAMLWRKSSAATELEEVAPAWHRQPPHRGAARHPRPRPRAR